jgi:hypothetical protein
MWLRAIKIPFIIFTIAFAGYLANLPTDYSISLKTRIFRRLISSYDVTATTFLPYEVIRHGTLYFSESTYKAMKSAQTKDQHMYSAVKRNGVYFSAYPFLAGLMAIPIYLLPILLNKIPTLQYIENLVNILALGRIAASFYTAIAVALFYLILKELDKLRTKQSGQWLYIFTAFFAFGTNVYSIASRSLWQHTSSLFFIVLIIYFLLKALTDDKYVKWLGLFAALLYIARPLNIVLVVCLSLYIFFTYRKQFLKYILFALPFATLLFAYNTYAWGYPFTTEYVVKGDTGFTTPILYGIGGNLFSPARSFFFITPPLVISYFAMYLILRKRHKTHLELVLSMLSITYIIIFLLYSKWWCWDGADRFGYGFFTEWVPIVALLTYLTTQEWKKSAKLLLIVLMVWSIYAQTNAVWYRKNRCNGNQHNWTFYCLKPGWLDKQDY